MQEGVAAPWRHMVLTCWVQSLKWFLCQAGTLTTLDLFLPSNAKGVLDGMKQTSDHWRCKLAITKKKKRTRHTGRSKSVITANINQTTLKNVIWRTDPNYGLQISLYCMAQSHGAWNFGISRLQAWCIQVWVRAEKLTTFWIIENWIIYTTHCRDQYGQRIKFCG